MLIADEQNVREALKKNNSNTLQNEKLTLKSSTTCTRR